MQGLLFAPIAMANWYYFNKSGEKIGPITSAALKALAQQGHITPETIVEFEDGRIFTADKVHGITIMPPTVWEVQTKNGSFEQIYINELLALIKKGQVSRMTWVKQNGVKLRAGQCGDLTLRFPAGMVGAVDNYCYLFIFLQLIFGHSLCRGSFADGGSFVIVGSPVIDVVVVESFCNAGLSGFL